MAELFASGRIIDVIIVLMLVEGAVLAWWHARTGRGIAPRQLAGLLPAGGFLLLAVRAALTGEAWPWCAGFLLLGLVAHLADLVVRWRR